MMPSGWKFYQLLEFVESMIAGVSVNSDDSIGLGDGPRVLKTSSVTSGVFIPEESKRIIDTEVSRARTSPIGDSIIMSRMNTQALVGASAYIANSYPNLFLPDRLWLIRGKREQVSIKWLSSVLGSDRIRSRISGIATGTSGSMKNISKESILSLEILTPPKIEQEKIAKILAAWDEAISLTESLLLKKKLTKTHFLNKIFSGKECLQGKKREEYLLDFVFEQRSERGGEGDLLSVTRDRGIIPQTESDKKDTSNSDKSKYLRIYPNDIVYNTMRMWQGVSAVSRLQGLVSPAYTVCYLKNNEFSVDYFGYFFKNKKMIHEFHRRSQGLVDDTLNLKFENFRKIKIFVHPPKQQVAIARCFGALDAEISLLQKMIRQLNHQKQGLMQQLLTGKRRVKV